MAPIAVGKPPRPRSGHRSVRASIAQFAIAGLVVTVTLAALTGVLARRAGAAQATRSFEDLAWITAASLSPSLDAASSASPKTQADLWSVVAALHEEGTVVRVKIWDATGQVVWSDEPRLAGQRFALDAAQQEALHDGTSGSERTDGSRPQDRYEQDMGPLLEAYVGVQDIHGTPLLVDVFESYDDTAVAAWDSWLGFAPSALGALLLLELIQVPLAWRLARRLREAQDAEDSLLTAAVQASDTERRRIAGELHDHVVQDLTGLAYELDDARLRNDVRDEHAAQLIARTAGGIRRSIGDLRTMLSSLMPAQPASDGLGPALESLGTGLRASGARVRVRTSGLADVSPPVAALLYRCAEEALRNVAAHSRARAVDVTVRAEASGVTMIIDDDGRGFDEGRLKARESAGHVGLRALGDLLREAGGSLTASSAPGQGTRLVITVPLERSPAGTGALR